MDYTESGWDAGACGSPINNDQSALDWNYKQLTGAKVWDAFEGPYISNIRATQTKDETTVTYNDGVLPTVVGVKTVNFESKELIPPVITIATPTDASKTNNPSCTITGTVTDSDTLDSGVREVKVFLNGDQQGSDYTTTDPVNFNEAVTLADGWNTIRVDAKDFAGNTDSDAITVLLDTAKPVITLGDDFGAVSRAAGHLHGHSDGN